MQQGLEGSREASLSTWGKDGRRKADEDGEVHSSRGENCKISLVGKAFGKPKDPSSEPRNQGKDKTTKQTNQQTRCGDKSLESRTLEESGSQELLEASEPSPLGEF